MQEHTRKLVMVGMFITIGIVLPMGFHMVAGPMGGRTFLPMHIPVLLAGFMAGPLFGFIVGIVTPVLSFMATGMPPISPPTMQLMIFELGAYGLISGIAFSYIRGGILSIYICLIVAMIGGRAVYGLAVWGLAGILGIKISPFTAVLGGLITGLPGIAIQLLLIPVIVKRVRDIPRFIW